jgi:hypothetical protein
MENIIALEENLPQKVSSYYFPKIISYFFLQNIGRKIYMEINNMTFFCGLGEQISLLGEKNNNHNLRSNTHNLGSYIYKARWRSGSHAPSTEVAAIFSSFLSSLSFIYRHCRSGSTYRRRAMANVQVCILPNTRWPPSGWYFFSLGWKYSRHVL